MHLEFGGEGVDRLNPDTVEADRLFESFGVVFRAGVDFRGAVLELAERDAAAVVTHCHVGAVDIDFDDLTVAHHELVDRVVDHLLEEDVNTIVRG